MAGIDSYPFKKRKSVTLLNELGKDVTGDETLNETRVTNAAGRVKSSLINSVTAQELMSGE